MVLLGLVASVTHWLLSLLLQVASYLHSIGSKDRHRLEANLEPVYDTQTDRGTDKLDIEVTRFS